MTSERPWARQPSARSPRRPWQNGALMPSLQVAIMGSLSAPAAGAAANGRANANAVASMQNHRVINDTTGHPLDFMPSIMALSRWSRADLRFPHVGKQPCEIPSQHFLDFARGPTSMDQIIGQGRESSGVVVLGNQVEYIGASPGADTPALILSSTNL